MAGVYGRINSRADFLQVLEETRQATQQFLRTMPGNPSLERVARELEAMQQWSADGRTPAKEERKRIDIGAVAVREFAEEDDWKFDPN